MTQATLPGVPAASAPTGADGHLLPFGDRGWRVWREALLRGAGFPAAGLRQLAAPQAAAAADAVLAGGERGAYDRAYATAVRAGAERIAAISADPLFLEALAWQNPSVLVIADRLRAAAADGEPPRNKTQWTREETLSRYWQRYCGKNDTIGFFGPVGWTSLRTEGPAVIARPGPNLVVRRQVFFERWALAAYADTLAADPDTRRHLPVRLAPQLSRSGRVVYGVPSGPVTLTAADAAVVAACDGRRSAARIAADLVAAGTAGLRRTDDVLAQIDQLTRRRLLRWGIDLPMDLTAESALADALAAIDEPTIRHRAQDDLARLRAARDEAAAAAGDHRALHAALSRLDDEFTARTGVDSQQRGGETYAGRRLCYEETVRDLDVSFGPQILRAISAPMQLALSAARWLTSALADAYHAALRELYEDLAAGGDGPVRLSDLWFLAYGLLFGDGQRPVDRVAEEFAARMATLFGLDDDTLARSRVHYTADELADRAAELFAAPAPGWRLAQIHSPDLQICAPSTEAVNAGEFIVVLGELHAAWPTFDCSVFAVGHDDPERLRAGLAADLGGPGRVDLVYPTNWPGYTGRVSHCLAHPDDWRLAFTDAPGAGRRCLAVSELMVSDVRGRLVAADADGHRWPLLELFAPLMTIHAVDGFKLMTNAPHTPRLSVDRLVLDREQWRSTVGRLGLTHTRRGADRYLAARRMVADLGLPDEVFVRIGTEMKPVYVDLTSPVFVSSLATMLRSARRRGGDGVRVTFSELLPGPDQAWLCDADGNRYLSELRMQLVDPVPAGTADHRRGEASA